MKKTSFSFEQLIALVIFGKKPVIDIKYINDGLANLFQ